jgi:hypothetical protein
MMLVVARHRLASAILGFFALVAAPRIASASPSARLAYARGRGAEACPDETVLRAAVAKRVGYDPFFPFASQTVIVQVEVRPQGFVARVQVVDAKGVVHGERSLPLQKDCDEAVAAAALSVSLALGDASGAEEEPPPKADLADAAADRASPAPPPEPLPPLLVPAPTHEKPSAPPGEQRRLRGVAWLGAGGSLGASPAAALALALGGGVRLRPFELGVEGHYDAPSTKAVSPRAELSSETVSVGMVGCFTYRMAFGCVGAALGRLATETSGITSPRADSALVAFASARVGAALSITDGLLVRFYLEGRGLLNPPEVDIAGQSVYRMSPIAVFLFVSPVVQF